MNEADLTDKERCWLAWFCETLNASQAARECYDCTDESARTIGHRNLVKMRALINDRLAEVIPSAEQTMARISDIAMSDISPYVDAAGNVDIEKLIADRKGFLIEGVRPVRGGIAWTFADRTAALRLLARYHRLVNTDEVQVKLERGPVPDEDEVARMVAMLRGLASDGSPSPVDGKDEP